MMVSESDPSALASAALRGFALSAEVVLDGSGSVASIYPNFAASIARRSSTFWGGFGEVARLRGRDVREVGRVREGQAA